MSEVAVKIYETRKDIQRFKLTEPIHGKDGKRQQGKFIDLDTGKMVKELVYKRIGKYSICHTFLGKNVESVSGPFPTVPGETFLYAVEQVNVMTDSLDNHEGIFYVSVANLKVPFGDFRKISPDCIITDCYIVVRYLDE